MPSIKFTWPLRGRAWWWLLPIIFLSFAAGIVAICLAHSKSNRSNPSAAFVPGALEEALRRRLLQATVGIAPTGTKIVGCRVLIDSKEMLVVTLEAVMGDRVSATASVASTLCKDARGGLISPPN